MFETSSVNRRRRKFHPMTFLVSALLHIAAIGTVTFFTIWDVETPERAPNQVVVFRASTSPPVPPPPPPPPGDPEGQPDPEPDTTVDETPIIDRAPTDIPSEIPDPSGDTDDRGDSTSDLPFGDPTGEDGGDPTGRPGGAPGGTGDRPGGGVIDGKTYDVGEGVRAPVVIRRVDPVYPPLLQRIGKSGVVHLECVISKSGQLTDIQVIQSSHPLFSEAAIEAVNQWRFLPGSFEGRPIATRFDFRVNFNVQR